MIISLYLLFFMKRWQPNINKFNKFVDDLAAKLTQFKTRGLNFLVKVNHIFINN